MSEILNPKMGETLRCARELHSLLEQATEYSRRVS